MTTGAAFLRSTGSWWACPWTARKKSMIPCGGAEGTKPIPPEQEACLRDLLLFLEKENKKALFLVSPYGVSLEEQQMFNYMEEITSSYG